MDADQLHDLKAKVLLFVTVNGPMYIGTPLFADGVAVKFDRSTRNAALLLSDRFTIITILS